MLAGLRDIHSAVDRIAEIGSVNTVKVRRTLLDAWLASSSSIHEQESADVTVVGDEAFTDSNTPAEQVSRVRKMFFYICIIMCFDSVPSVL